MATRKTGSRRVVVDGTPTAGVSVIVLPPSRPTTVMASCTWPSSWPRGPARSWSCSPATPIRPTGAARRSSRSRRRMSPVGSVRRFGRVGVHPEPGRKSTSVWSALRSSRPPNLALQRTRPRAALQASVYAHRSVAGPLSFHVRRLDCNPGGRARRRRRRSCPGYPRRRSCPGCPRRRSCPGMRGPGSCPPQRRVGGRGRRLRRRCPAAGSPVVRLGPLPGIGGRATLSQRRPGSACGLTSRCSGPRTAATPGAESIPVRRCGSAELCR